MVACAKVAGAQLENEIATVAVVDAARGVRLTYAQLEAESRRGTAAGSVGVSSSSCGLLRYCRPISSAAVVGGPKALDCFDCFARLRESEPFLHVPIPRLLQCLSLIVFISP